MWAAGILSVRVKGSLINESFSFSSVDIDVDINLLGSVNLEAPGNKPFA